MKLKLLPLALFMTLPISALMAENPKVIIDPNTIQYFNDIKTLEREKFINMHEIPGSINKSDLEEIQELGISFGRGTFSPFAGSSVKRGITDEQIKTQGVNWLNRIKNQGVDTPKDMMAGSIVTSHPVPGETKEGNYAFEWKGLDADYTPEAEFAAKFFKYTFSDQGLNTPTYYEPMNEPFVKTKAYKEIPQADVITEMCRYHKAMAEYLQKEFPDMMVGGFASAWPLFEGFKSDFQHWNQRMKKYIDITNGNSDFLSIHIYDGRNMQGASSKRSGSNMEALLDMMEGYTTIKFGKPTPIVISEHGLTQSGMTGCPYTRERDWIITEALNHQMIQFMLRPANLKKTIPFILTKATWGESNGYPYPWVLQHKDGKGGWKKTDLYKFYEFWQEFKGDYIFSQGDEIDLLSLAVADDNTLRIVLNSLENDEIVDLSIAKLRGNKLKSISLKSIYGEGEDRITTIKTRDITTEQLKNIKIRKGETLMLTAEYTKSIKNKRELRSKKFYATSYCKPIKAEETNTFTLNIDKGRIEEATLKIGIARPHGVAINPVLKVNGKSYPFPTDWKGYDQESRVKDGFFGIIDVVINPTDLKETNSISLQFPSDRGTISTVGATVNYKL